MEATRRDPACEMRFQTLLQWTASISGSLSLLGSGYVLHDLRAKRRANDGVLSVGEQLAAVLSLFDCGASVPHAPRRSRRRNRDAARHRACRNG